tara:strand:+ start:2759 stop:3727 length:969 start_codon:yes stop_codon:yes gene_type:complete
MEIELPKAAVSVPNMPQVKKGFEWPLEIGDTIVVPCGTSGDSAKCVFGDDGCYPDGEACLNNPSHKHLYNPSASSTACKDLGKFLQENRELIATARRAFAMFIQNKDTFNTAQKHIEHLKTTNMNNISQVFLDQIIGKLRISYMEYLASRTGLERDLKEVAIAAATSQLVGYSSDKEKMNAFLMQLIADSEYISTFSTCNPDCGEHGTCRTTYNDEFSWFDCDIGCDSSGFTVSCDKGSKGQCICRDGYTGSTCNIPPGGQSKENMTLNDSNVLNDSEVQKNQSTKQKGLSTADIVAIIGGSVLCVLLVALIAYAIPKKKCT